MSDPAIAAQTITAEPAPDFAPAQSAEIVVAPENVAPENAAADERGESNEGAAASALALADAAVPLTSIAAAEARAASELSRLAERIAQFRTLAATQTEVSSVAPKPIEPGPAKVAMTGRKTAGTDLDQPQAMPPRTSAEVITHPSALARLQPRSPAAISAEPPAAGPSSPPASTPRAAAASSMPRQLIDARANPESPAEDGQTSAWRPAREETEPSTRLGFFVGVALAAACGAVVYIVLA